MKLKMQLTLLYKGEKLQLGEPTCAPLWLKWFIEKNIHVRHNGNEHLFDSCRADMLSIHLNRVLCEKERIKFPSKEEMSRYKNPYMAKSQNSDEYYEEVRDAMRKLNWIGMLGNRFFFTEEGPDAQVTFYEEEE